MNDAKLPMTGPEWMIRSLSPEQVGRLRRGEILLLGAKAFRLCANCLQVIRINKPVVGSFHLCKPDEEEGAEA
jgi:hypothetical protein